MKWTKEGQSCKILFPVFDSEMRATKIQTVKKHKTRIVFGGEMCYTQTQKAHHRICTGVVYVPLYAAWCDMDQQTKISEGEIMKKVTDDFLSWQVQQENISKPFPYVFPQMPPRFRRCCTFMKTIFLMQGVCFAVFCICGMMLFIPTVIWNKNMEISAIIENKPFLAFFIVAVALSLPIFFVAVLFGFTPKLFWRCPCCRHPFPYYVPTRGDNLKEKECLLTIKGQHIKYAKLKFCPLIIPSVCPECKCKFFEMTG